MLIQAFMQWWNRQAVVNGKVKFRNQREAADFVRSVARASGGPNAKVMEMRRQYVAVQKARSVNEQIESERRETVAHR